MEIISGNVMNSADMNIFPAPNSWKCWVKYDPKKKKKKNKKKKKKKKNMIQKFLKSQI